MINFHNIDCMEFMKALPDKAYDLAIVDPPYGIGESRQTRENSITDKWKNPPKAVVEIKDWDDETPPQEYFDELFRVSKNQIIWGGNYFIDKIKTPTMGWVFWDKKRGDKDFSHGELAYTSFNTKMRKFEWLWDGFRKQNPEERIHRCQKPIALYKFLLENYAKRGDKILDTHVGSASSLIACHDMGFDADGCEKDADYYRDALTRLNRHMAQGQLFNGDLGYTYDGTRTHN